MKSFGAGFISSMIVVAVALLLCSPAQAAYHYTDDNGTIHIVDDEKKVPEQYRSQVRTLKENEHTDGYAPSAGEAAANSGNPEASWFKYEQMSRMDRWRLVAEAGLVDLEGIVQDGKLLMAGVVVVFMGLMVLIIVKARGAGMKMMLCSLMLLCMAVSLGAIYMRTAMKRGDSIIQNLKELHSLKNGDQSAVADGGGVFDQLRQYQNIDAERQEMLQHILDEGR